MAELTQPGGSSGSVMDGISGSSTVSQEAQDIAQAQGVGYTQLATETENQETPEFADYDYGQVAEDVADTVSFQDSASYIDEAKATVAGQMQSLLSADNPYIKQQESLAREEAAAKGLRNTTMGVLAGRQAAIESALPIAQQDAETYAAAAGVQQEAEYAQEAIQGEAIVSGAMIKQKAEIEQKSQDIQNAFEAKMTGLSEQSKALLTDLQGSYEKSIAELEIASAEYLAEQELTFTENARIQETNATLMRNFQVTVENLMTDEELLEAGSDAVNNAISEALNLTKNMMKFSAASSGLDMTEFDDWIDDYFAAA